SVISAPTSETYLLVRNVSASSAVEISRALGGQRTGRQQAQYFDNAKINSTAAQNQLALSKVSEVDVALARTRNYGSDLSQQGGNAQNQLQNQAQNQYQNQYRDNRQQSPLFNNGGGNVGETKQVTAAPQPPASPTTDGAPGEPAPSAEIARARESAQNTASADTSKSKADNVVVNQGPREGPGETRLETAGGAPGKALGEKNVDTPGQDVSDTTDLLIVVQASTPVSAVPQIAWPEVRSPEIKSPEIRSTETAPDAGGLNSKPIDPTGVVPASSNASGALATPSTQATTLPATGPVGGSVPQSPGEAPAANP
ncbi:MAG: hypothetical protein H7144_06155, partial [Burkholderiales bacterium]|nr:hypothetical protein [Phycisphaerae bacterium]